MHSSNLPVSECSEGNSGGVIRVLQAVGRKNYKRCINIVYGDSMTQYEEVIAVMKEHGGYATLSYLYENVPVAHWKTKTPFHSIRRIVQTRPEFFKIKPGLWALVEYKDRLPKDISALMAEKETKETREYSHTYYQGLVAEIGTLKGLKTFVPNQDKNRMFMGKKLADVINIREFYNFGYENIVRRARTVDVIWFNERKMPDRFFEIEHSTDFQNSLLKFVEFQDYCAEFYIVSDEARYREFEMKISQNAFSPIRQRVRFIDYEKIALWHTKTYEQYMVEREIMA